MSNVSLAVKCKARRTNGEPCGAWAIRGGFVCRTHGGAAPQVRKAAAARYAVVRDLALDKLRIVLESKGEDLDPRLLLDAADRLAKHTADAQAAARAADEAADAKRDAAAEARDKVTGMLDELAARRKAATGGA